MIKKVGSIIALTVTLSVVGQKNNFSPYSAYGIGDKYKSRTVEQASMGGIGVAEQDSKSLNFVNPAALSKLRVTTYSFAVRTTFQELIKPTSSQKLNSSGLSFVALGFPLGKKAGMSLGLQPRSSVQYSLFNESLDAGGDVISSTQLEGAGGTNSLFLSFGVDVYKGISIGVQTSYVFGNIDKNIWNSESNNLIATKYSKNSHISGTQFKVGTYYQTNLSKTLQMSSGLAVKLASNLSSLEDERMYSLTYQSGKEIEDDVLFDRKDVGNSVSEPMSVVLGFGLGLKNHWYLGLNSEFTNRNKDLSNKTNINFSNSASTSLGGYYIPRINSISSYWNRITYRGGLRYEKTGIKVKEPGSSDFYSLNDFGINFGLSLPLPKSISSINLGVEYGVKATASEILAKDRYFNLRLGFSLNSLKWFQKREID